MQNQQTRIPELDGIRGCAILLVIIWHYVPCQIGSPESGSLDYYIVRSLSLTKSGVDLFFVLSGFLITGILLDKRASSNYFSVFYLRRICRIFPLYFLLLGSFVVLSSIDFDESYRFRWLFMNSFPIWTYATFTQNVVMGLRGTFGAQWLGITWSLAVEEQFYCIVPLLVWLLPRRKFVWVVVLLIFLAPLLRSLSTPLVAYAWTPCRADSLLMGSLLAVAVRDERILSLLRANVGILHTTLLGFLGGAAFLTYRPHIFGKADHTWLACLYGLFILIPIVDNRTLIAKVLRNRLLKWLGILSYGLYMYHQAMSGLVHGLFGNGIPSVTSAYGFALTLTAFLLTCLVSTISFHVFERPITDWGHRFRYLVKQPQPEAPLEVAPQ